MKPKIDAKTHFRGNLSWFHLISLKTFNQNLHINIKNNFKKAYYLKKHPAFFFAEKVFRVKTEDSGNPAYEK